MPSSKSECFFSGVISRYGWMNSFRSIDRLYYTACQRSNNWSLTRYTSSSIVWRIKNKIGWKFKWKLSLIIYEGSFKRLVPTSYSWLKKRKRKRLEYWRKSINEVYSRVFKRTFINCWFRVERWGEKKSEKARLGVIMKIDRCLRVTCLFSQLHYYLSNVKYYTCNILHYESVRLCNIASIKFLF